MSNPVIAVVIVNYRTPDLVVAGLKALEQERVAFPGLHVILVDNQSPDDSVTQLQSAIDTYGWLEWVRLVPAPINGGYAYGNNRGFEAAKHWLGQIDYLWMLNPDTQVRPGATAALIQFLQRHPRAIAGSCLEDRDGTKQVSTFNFPSVLSEACSGFSLGFLDRLLIQHRVTRDIPKQREACDWLAGASLMFTAQVQDELGHLDEGYFLYFEEVDYLLQANRQGIPCWYIPDSRVIHEVGAATGISDVRKRQPRRPTYWFESRRRYFLKNHGRVTLLAADLLWVLGYSSWCLRKSISNRQHLAQQPPKLFSDFLLQSQLNPGNWFHSVKA